MIEADVLLSKMIPLWCEYISLDHHKSRDIYFHVVKQWSLDYEPTYSFQHNGYVAAEYYGEDRDCYSAAAWDGVFFLRSEFKDAIDFLQREIEIFDKQTDTSEDWSWHIGDADDRVKIVDLMERMKGVG